MLTKRYLLIIVVALLLAPHATRAEGHVETLVFGGAERSVYLHLPPAHDGTTPLPLVVALHPAASSGKAMAALTGLDDAADRGGFIVAFPNSRWGTWEEGRIWGEDRARTGDEPNRNVGFIRALVAQLSTRYAVDPERVYLTGFGNGGLLAYRLACETPDLFEAVAVVGALMWDYQRDACAGATTPVNLLIIHGTRDPYYPTDTHEHPAVEGAMVLGVDDTLTFWRERNGCSPERVAETNNTRIYTECDGGTSLALYRVLGGGQSWPRVGTQQLNRYGVDATEMVTRFFAGGTDWTTPQPQAFEHPARSYALYVPASYDPAKPMPLVLALHGRGGTGTGMAALTDLNDLAEEHGFIALYPDGLEYQWNYVRGVPGYDTAPDDTRFLSDLIHDLALELNIDETRIYATGFSNGGFMVERLACDAPEQYAAFAAVGATGFGGMELVCPATGAVRLLFIHGTFDTNIPWNGLGQRMGERVVYITYSVPDTLAFWTAYNGCDPRFEATDLPSSGESPDTRVHLLSFETCPPGSALALYAVEGGGHNWPGKPGRLPEEGAGAVTSDIDAGEVIWEFFSRYTNAAPQ